MKGARLPSTPSAGWRPKASISEPPPTREELLRRDREELRRLGYAQQLFREMGGFSNFAISFSIISVLTGAVLLFGYGLKLAGPVVNTVGWPLVSLFTMAVAASMAELASEYPTAGGLYFWAFRLGGRGWAWLTAWLNMVGQVTITAGVNVAAAIYVIGAATRILGVPDDVRLGALGPVTGWHFQLAVMGALMVPQVLLNLYGVRLVRRLNDFSVWWHILGGAVIVALLAFWGRHHNALSFLFAARPSVDAYEIGRTMVVGDAKLASPLFALFPGLAHLYASAPFALLFVLALLQAQWTYTGYDASAHVAEETVLARLNSAWGVFLSVAVSAVVGYVLLVVLTWCIPGGDVAKAAADPYPVLYIARENLAPFLADVVAVIVGVAMWLCGCASITSMSRMWYAFARDGGLPFGRRLARVNARTGVPASSVVVTSALAVLVCLYAAAFTVVTSISTIALYLAYAIPIALNRRNRRRGRGAHTSPATPWNLGRWGVLVNTVALAWVAFIAVVFSLPPNELVLWTMLGLGALLLLYWWLWARARFEGPAAASASATAP